jgi:2-C-methyl-D-erythritol 4-phosphate cytidylyltransferase
VGAIVLAAGSGARFGGAKQFQELRPGQRLVDAALDLVVPVADAVVVVLPAGALWDGPASIVAVTGGADRTASVSAGMACLDDDVDVVLVHDAAHPLAPPDTVHELLDAMTGGADAAVPFLPAAEVIKHRTEDGRLRTVGRDGLGLAQMPMAFTRQALTESLARSAEGYEDSARVEAAGGVVRAVAGSSRNVHVVQPEDLELVRLIAAASHDAEA